MTGDAHERRLCPAAQEHLLEGILARVVERCATGRPVVVLDLDSTLIDNRPRTLAILRRLARRWGETRAHFAEGLARIEANDVPFLVEALLGRLGDPPADLLDEVRSYWACHFFSNRFLHLDRPYPGAVEFASSCHSAGATVVYFTARPLARMGTGTVRSLCGLGFPYGIPRVELVMKQDVALSDREFKLECAPEIGQIGEVVAAFDNEPHHCNCLKAAFPEAVVCLVDTQHHPSAPALDPHVAVVENLGMGRL